MVRLLQIHQLQDELLGLFKAVLDSMGSGTDDEGVVRRCQMLRDHGQSKKYFHDIEGPTAGWMPPRRGCCG